MKGRHHFPVRIERKLCPARKSQLLFFTEYSVLGSKVQKCELRRISYPFFSYSRVVAQYRRPEKLLPHRTFGRFFLTKVYKALFHCHTVFRQCPCFIRTDHIYCPQRFHTGKTSDNSIDLYHPRHAQGKAERDYCGKPLRDRRYRQRNRCQKHFKHIPLLPHGDKEQCHTDTERKDTQKLSQIAQALLQRSHLLPALAHHRRYPADLRLHSRRSYHPFCSADSHDR